MKVRLGRGLVKAFVCLMAILALCLCAVLAVRVWEEKENRAQKAAEAGDEADKKEEDLVYYENAWYTPKKSLETVLILGIDKYVEDSSQSVHGTFEQADFIMLLILDRKVGASVGIHLNRDTMTEISVLNNVGAVAETKIGQLTLSHTYGGTAEIRCKNTVDAVSNLLYGMKIDHYLSLTMDSVAVLNDLAGGITLEVLDDFKGIDDTLVKGETVTLRGSQALTYVRTRKDLEDSSNLRRMKRQRQYLEALQTCVFEKMDTDDTFMLSALSRVNPYLVSDCSVEQLSDLAEAIKECGQREYLTLEGEAKKGKNYVEFYVNEDALQKMVMDVFYERDADYEVQSIGDYGH